MIAKKTGHKTSANIQKKNGQNMKRYDIAIRYYKKH